MKASAACEVLRTHTVAGPRVDPCRVVARVRMEGVVELQGIRLTRGLDAVLSCYRSCCVGKDRRSLIGAGCVEWPGAKTRNEIWGEARLVEWFAVQVGPGLEKIPCG